MPCEHDGYGVVQHVSVWRKERDGCRRKDKFSRLHISGLRSCSSPAVDLAWRQCDCIVKRATCSGVTPAATDFTLPAAGVGAGRTSCSSSSSPPGALQCFASRPAPHSPFFMALSEVSASITLTSGAGGAAATPVAILLASLTGGALPKVAGAHMVTGAHLVRAALAFGSGTKAGFAASTDAALTQACTFCFEAGAGDGRILCQY